MKIYAISLAYVPARIALTTLEQVYKTIGIKPERHLVLMQHYPVDEKRNDGLLRNIFDAYELETRDLCENVGLSQGYNYLVNQINLKDEDIIIGIDLDVYPITPGWGQALADVASNPIVGWASLTFPVVDREMNERGFDIGIINGRNVKFPRQTCMSSICGVRAEMWKTLGGINEPKKYYGGAECATNPKIVALGKRWAYLPDFREEHTPLTGSEPLYAQWKWKYAIENSVQTDFRTWLKENGHL